MLLLLLKWFDLIFFLFAARPGGSTGSSELENIQDRYMTCLRVYTQHMYPQQPTRFQDLLGRLPEVSFHIENVQLNGFYKFVFLLF